jgi:hypothetical protein
MRRVYHDAAQPGLDRRPHNGEPAYPQDNLHQWAYDESLNFEQFSAGGQDRGMARAPVPGPGAPPSTALPDDISELLAMLVSICSCQQRIRADIRSPSLRSIPQAATCTRRCTALRKSAPAEADCNSRPTAAVQVRPATLASLGSSRHAIRPLRWHHGTLRQRRAAQG